MSLTPANPQLIKNIALKRNTCYLKYSNCLRHLVPSHTREIYKLSIVRIELVHVRTTGAPGI